MQQLAITSADGMPISQIKPVVMNGLKAKTNLTRCSINRERRAVPPSTQQDEAG